MNWESSPNTQPKTMVKIQGAPILSHIVDAYHAVGIKDILVVRGYKKEAVNLPNLTYIDNDEFCETGELDSLLKALQSRAGHFQPTIVSYGDVLFNKYIPQALCQEQDDCVIFVDSNWQDRTSYARLDGFVECTVPNSRKAFNAKVYLKQLGNQCSQRSHPRGLDGVSQTLFRRNQPDQWDSCGNPRRSGKPKSGHPAVVTRTAEATTPRPSVVYSGALVGYQ